MRKKNFKLVSCIAAFAMVFCLLFGMAVPASATEDEVRATADGVFQFNLVVNDQRYPMGSCFLINDSTIITANHCTTVFSESDYALIYEIFGIKKSEIEKESIAYSVTIARDFTVPATIVNASENMDFAILRLSQPLSNRTPLVMRDSKTVQPAEKTYSVGFPRSKTSASVTAQYFNKSDMAFESGTVNKSQCTDTFLVDNIYKVAGEIITSSAGTTSAGNSGGPMVDEHGCVIGVVSASNDGACYASASSQIMDILDTIGIKYDKCPHGSAPVPSTDDSNSVDNSRLQSLIAEAEDCDKEDYSEDSYDELKSALRDARSALTATTQAEVDAAANRLSDAIDDLEKVEETKKDGFPMLVVLIAVIAAVVIAAVIVLIVVLGNKNKKTEQAPAAPAYPTNNAKLPQQSVPAMPAARDDDDMGTSVLSGDAAGTTVLSGDAAGTTVLTQTVNGGTLESIRSGEIVQINRNGFTIGKKRREVDYCIGNNTNVSRVHAIFTVRDGKTFISDNKSTNGTYVNSVTVRPGQEVELNDGDTIMLADEEFKFVK